MKTEKIIKITRYICDFCKKSVPNELRIAYGPLDFCNKQCFENYKNQNSLPFKKKC